MICLFSDPAEVDQLKAPEFQRISGTVTKLPLQNIDFFGQFIAIQRDFSGLFCFRSIVETGDQPVAILGILDRFQNDCIIGAVIEAGLGTTGFTDSTFTGGLFSS